MRYTGFKTLQFQITQCKDCKHLVGIHSVRCFSCIGLYTCLYVHMSLCCVCGSLCDKRSITEVQGCALGQAFRLVLC